MQDDLCGHAPKKRKPFAEPVPVFFSVQHAPDTIGALMDELLAEAPAPT